MPDRRVEAGQGELQRGMDVALKIDRRRSELRFDGLSRAAELERTVKEFPLLAVAPMNRCLPAVGGRADEPRAGARQHTVIKMRRDFAGYRVEVILQQVDPQTAVLEGELVGPQQVLGNGQSFRRQIGFGRGPLRAGRRGQQRAEEAVQPVFHFAVRAVRVVNVTPSSIRGIIEKVARPAPRKVRRAQRAQRTAAA